MYENYVYNGKTLAVWQKELEYKFSLGELYRMAQEGEDLSKYAIS